MNRSVAMIVAGAVTTLVVIGGTMAISQSGALAGGTTIQKDGEIAVQVSTVEVMPKATAATEPVVQQPEATAVTTDTPAVEDTVQKMSDVEALLRQRLDEAYKTLQSRDSLYQARLKEAYAKLKAAEASANAAVTTTTTIVQDNSQPAVVTAAEHHDDDNHVGDEHHVEADHHDDHHSDDKPGDGH